MAQGIASRGVNPVPRGKPSGRPFPVRLVDVAAEAGLRALVIYGGVERKEYIPETVGCGCAFFDYDNDGWMDILLLSGTRRNDPPKEATIRLYKNNRNGMFTEVTEKAGLARHGWASAVTVGDYNNDGFDSVNDSRIHFGLGGERFADLEIRWPRGRRQTLSKVPADQILTITEKTAP